MRLQVQAQCSQQAPSRYKRRTSVCEVSSCSSPLSFFSGALVFLARWTMSSALPWSAVTCTPRPRSRRAHSPQEARALPPKPPKPLTRTARA